ncbi:MAG TPA: GH92 family glycosyl hydrolase [Solirubrobacterales bacterium]|nr:GH92 family glycosyl hydrolase [Solirubrobacterales bacterium]
MCGFRVGAAAEDQRQGEDDRGRRQCCQGCIPPTHRSGNITRNIQKHRRRAGSAVLILALSLAAAVPMSAAADFAGHVNPFAGTRPGPGTFGGGHNFPGAALPFGMVQWSPDTTPVAPHSGGYDHRDNHVTGFSLTHLSGAGCAIYGDFPFLPTTEPIDSSPAQPGGGLDGRFQPGFSHSEEAGRPGFYRVRLNPVGGADVDVALTATTRTGMARFRFPPSPHASVLINAGGSAQPNDFAAIEVDPGRREISGSASSGHFCGQRPRYRIYFAARFDRRFDAHGTWRGDSLDRGGRTAEDSQAPAENPRTTAQAGAYASFDTRGSRVVTARVGISFVSVDGARANLAAESQRAGFAAIAARARNRWNQALGRVRVSGGPKRLLGTFYTALYHAFLAPRTFNDVNGSYLGMDGQVHDAGGRTQYADFSGWDIYRSQIQLLSMLMPERASEMIGSLLADAEESGCLPRWSYANGQSMTMVGDSADPIIASAAAFGAGAFDQRAALAAMVRGATEPCRSANGDYLQRQGLDAYLDLGYVPFNLDTNTRNANSLYGDPDSVWGSAATTLEYAVDDFAIAQFAARSLRDRPSYLAFMRRSSNWRRLFNPASGMVEPRFADGRFPPSYDNLRGGGFVEGNSAQYTWMVPQDPAGLIGRLGGSARAAGRLTHFLRQLNGGAGGTHTDHALLGNEPTLHTPWLYNWMRRPYRTQAVVRRALLSLYDTSADGYPGNDDLGTLSAWYVFGVLGLYPEVPGVGVLAIGSPLFERTEVRLPQRRRALILASGRGPYVQSLRLDGRGYAKPWTTYCALARGATLSFRLGSRPNRRWGAAAAAAPPSFGAGRAMPKGRCSP